MLYFPDVLYVYHIKYNTQKVQMQVQVLSSTNASTCANTGLFMYVQLQIQICLLQVHVKEFCMTVADNFMGINIVRYAPDIVGK